MTSFGVKCRLIAFGEEAGLTDFGVPVGLDWALEENGVNFVFSPAVKDLALGLPTMIKKNLVNIIPFTHNTSKN